MKILIVDDEPLALSRLQRLLGALGHTDITAASTSAEAFEHASARSYDLAFLDISMEGMDGIALGHALRSLDEGIAIVYQTAHENHALEAFRVGAVDYLLKPYTAEQLHEAIVRVRPAALNPPLRLIAKTGETDRLLTPDQILYVQADLSEVILRTREAFCYYPKKISDLETILEPHGFFRVHRSYLINLDAVSTMETIEQSRIRFWFQGVCEYVDSSKEGGKQFRDRFKML